MKLKLKKINFNAGRPVCILHEKTAKEMGWAVGGRVLITAKKKKLISIVDTSNKIISPNQIIVSETI